MTEDLGMRSCDRGFCEGIALRSQCTTLVTEDFVTVLLTEPVFESCERR